MHATRANAVRTPAVVALAAVFAVLAVLDLVATFAGYDAWRPFTKPLLMPALLGIVLSVRGRLDRAHRWLAASLVFGTAGDVLLLSRSDAAFVEGTLAFAVAHVAYIECFVSAGSGTGLVRRFPWVAIPYALGWIGATVLVAPHMGVLAFVAIPYSLLLTTMAVFALDLVGRIPLRSAIFAAAGAALFMSSDSNIAFARFDPALAPPHVEFLIMLLYLAGQALIVAAFTVRPSAIR